MGEETDRQEKLPILQYLGTVGNSAAPPPPFGLLTVSRCDDIFFFLFSQSREQRKGQ